MHPQTLPKASVSSLFKLALPISANSLMRILSLFIMMVMLSKLGKTHLAAAALGLSGYLPNMTLVATTLFSLGILISHSRGAAQNPAEVGAWLRNGLVLGLSLSLIPAFILLQMPKLLIIFGQEPALVAKTTNYFRIAAFSLFPIVINTCLGQVLLATGHTRITNVLSVAALFINIGVASLFISGKFGLPRMELGALAFSVMVSELMALAACYYYITKRKIFQEFKLFRGSWRPDIVKIKKIINVGLPIGLQFASELAAISVITYLTGHLGVTALAATQISTQYFTLALTVILGLSHAVSMQTSYYYGASNKAELLQLIKAAFVLIIIFNCIFWLLVGLFNETMVSVYLAKTSEYGEIASLARILLIIMCLTALFDSTRNVLAGFLRGLHDSVVPMQIGAITMWVVMLPLAYLMGVVGQLGAIGLRLALPITFAVISVLLGLRLYKHYRAMPAA